MVKEVLRRSKFSFAEGVPDIRKARASTDDSCG